MFAHGFRGFYYIWDRRPYIVTVGEGGNVSRENGDRAVEDD